MAALRSPAIATRGRPRDAARDTVILQTTTRLLSEVGYDRLSIEAVAAQAGIAKTTIYRRWNSKAALVAATLQERTVAEMPTVESRDVRTATLDVVSWLAHQMADQDLGLLSTILAARRSDPELAIELQSTLGRDRIAMGRPLRDAAGRSGEKLRPDFEAVLSELAPAVLLHRILLDGTAPDRDRLTHLVDRILLPLLLEERRGQHTRPAITAATS